MQNEDRDNSSFMNVHMCKNYRGGRMEFWVITGKQEETERDDSQEKLAGKWS